MEEIDSFDMHLEYFRAYDKAADEMEDARLKLCLVLMNPAFNSDVKNVWPILKKMIDLTRVYFDPKCVYDKTRWTLKNVESPIKRPILIFMKEQLLSK